MAHDTDAGRPAGGARLSHPMSPFINTTTQPTKCTVCHDHPTWHGALCIVNAPHSSMHSTPKGLEKLAACPSCIAPPLALPQNDRLPPCPNLCT